MTTHEDAGRAFADRIVGTPGVMGEPGMDSSDHADAHEALAEIGEKLAELMKRCAQAQADDGPCDFGSTNPDGGWNCSANSFEAGAALQEVAEIVGITGPDDLWPDPRST